MHYSIFPGGKRIRPVLCMESCRTLGGNIYDALPAACALELIHNFSLVHDDLPCMDDDDYRRGQLTCHKKFSESDAVLAGDAMLSLAFEILTEIKSDKAMRLTIKEIACATGLFGMIGGQGLDIKYEGKKINDKLKAEINALKTGALFTASCVTGGIAAGAGRAELKKLEIYGKYFGDAFQIRDDIEDKEVSKEKLNIRRKGLDAAIPKAQTALDKFGKKADNLRYLVEQLGK